MDKKTAEQFLTEKGLWNYATTIKLGRNELKQFLDEFASLAPNKGQAVSKEEIEEMARKEYPTASFDGVISTDDNYAKFKRIAYEKGATAILQLLREQKGIDGWVSVKERLPIADEGDKLVTDGDSCMVAYFKQSKEWDFWENGAFWESINVTHWMDLPKVPAPPKETESR